MAIHYPVKDFASKQRQDFIKEQAKRIFKPERVVVEEYEEFHYEPESDNKLLIAMIIGIVLIMSLYLVNTQAIADDCAKPISPMSLVDYWGKE
jgi:hypothetical protein